MTDDRRAPPDADPAENTGLPDKTGWDAAPQGKDVPWHEPMVALKRKRFPVWARILLVMAAVTLTIFLIQAGITALPKLSPYYANETAAVQNLKSVASAESQYVKLRDFYALSGIELTNKQSLIAADLSSAFELWQNNGDSAKPVPKAGYIFRMLQGDLGNSPTSYYRVGGNPTMGIFTWGTIARATEPGTSGNHQFLITEMGAVYKHDEPLPGDPMFKHFLLDGEPDVFTGSDYEQKLAALGWTPVK